MYDVITVGSATVDVFAKTAFSELIKIIDPKGEKDFLAFPSGSKILIDELKFTIGGGGTNTAVALSRLGHKVAFAGKLGKGTNSDFIHSHLKKERIHLLCGHGTGNAGYSVILDTLEHDRTILAHKGVNNDLRNQDIPYKKVKTKWLYFSAMLHESFHTQEELSEFAEKKGIKIAYNPSSYLAKKGAKFLKNILSRTEILILNEEEACMLAGKKPIEKLLSSLIKLGPKIAVITNGKKNLGVMDDKYIYIAKPPFVKVVDSTGAGDAFAASFLSGIIRKNDIEFAIRLGIANACSVISHYGAKNDLMTFKKAANELRKFKVKIKKKKI
jgi:ribokinase